MHIWRNVLIALIANLSSFNVALAQGFEARDFCYFDTEHDARSGNVSPTAGAKKFREFLRALPKSEGGTHPLNTEENFAVIREYLDANWKLDPEAASRLASAINNGCYGYTKDTAEALLVFRKAEELGDQAAIAYFAVYTFAEARGNKRSEVKRELRKAITRLRETDAWNYRDSEIELLEALYLLVDLDQQLNKGRAQPEKVTQTCQRFSRSRDLWSRNGMAHVGLSNCYQYTAGWREDLTLSYAHWLAHLWSDGRQPSTYTFDLERRLGNSEQLEEAKKLAYLLTDRSWPNEKAAGNGGSFAQTPDPDDSQMTLVSSGSAFFISEFLLATNAHVVADARRIKVTAGGKEQVVELVVSDPDLDLAILRLDQPAEGQRACFSIEKASMSAPGTRIYAVGFPYSGLLSSDAKITEGVVSSKNGLGSDTKTFQISAALQPGNSGGPIFDGSGKLVGIAVSKLKFGQNVNFAIKPIYLQALLESVGAEARCQAEFAPIGDSPAGFETTLALVASYQ